MAKEPYDAFDLRAQEQERAEAQERAKIKAKRESEALVWMMRDKRGRLTIYGLLERAGVWRSSFHTNALQMAFNEGQRNEGLAMLARLMEACPDLYSQMLKEQKDDE